MPTPGWKRWLILACGLMENLVFSGSILGWSALNYMLKQEGIFSELCTVSTGTPAPALPPLVLSNLRNLDPVEFNRNRLAQYNYSLTLGREKFDPPLSSAFDQEPRPFPQAQDSARVTGCAAQDRVLNLAYTVGSFFNGFTAFIWGFLLDRWGLRKVRLIINSFLLAGSLLLCFTSQSTSYLTFPAITLLCLGGVPLRIANMQIANLFPKNRSAVITFYSGAFSASAIIFVVLKYAYDGGISFAWACSTLVCFALAMIPFTLFVLPAQQIREESLPDSFENLILNKKYHAKRAFAHIEPSVTLEKFQIIGSPRLDRKSSTGSADSVPTKISVVATNTVLSAQNNNEGNSKDMVMSNRCHKDVDSIRAPSSAASSEIEIPLKNSLLSLPFTLHQWWYSWLITYMIMYVGTMNLWLQRVTTDIQVAGNFSKVFGIVQVLALVLAPIAGFLMDYQVNRASQELDPFKRRLNRIRAGFWPMLFTTATIAGALVCRFFDSTTAIYMSIAFITLLRSFLIAVASAYLRIRFPASHFNRLLGIMSTCGSFVTLLQFPLFVWEAQDDSNALWVNLLNCFLTSLAFLNPLHLIVTSLQRRLITKEVAAEERRVDETFK